MKQPCYTQGDSNYYLYEVEMAVNITTRVCALDNTDVLEKVKEQLDEDIHCDFDVVECYITELGPDDV